MVHASSSTWERYFFSSETVNIGEIVSIEPIRENSRLSTRHRSFYNCRYGMLYNKNSRAIFTVSCFYEKRISCVLRSEAGCVVFDGWLRLEICCTWTRNFAKILWRFAKEAPLLRVQWNNVVALLTSFETKVGMQRPGTTDTCTNSSASNEFSHGRFGRHNDTTTPLKSQEVNVINILKGDSKLKRSDVVMEDGDQSICSASEGAESISAKKKDRGVS